MRFLCNETEFINMIYVLIKILPNVMKNKVYHKNPDNLFDDKDTDTDKEPVGLFSIPITDI